MDAFGYIDEPRSGVMNMAIDDAMLDFASKQRAVLLRLYQWSEPTLSLGYFQRINERDLHSPSSNLALVRRATGGGAIVHHHDLTYSLAVPQSNSSVGAALAIYGAVHEAVVKWLNGFEIAVSQWKRICNLPTTGVQLAVANKSEFLCFHRRSEGDVVAGEHKLMGSAQRRCGGAILQHGSLLIAKSCHSPSLLGLKELLPNRELQPHDAEVLANRRLFAEEMFLRIRMGIDALLDVQVKYADHLAEMLRSAATVKMARFEASDWQCRV